jgi:hypothetical protein
VDLLLALVQRWSARRAEPGARTGRGRHDPTEVPMPLGVP